MHEGGTLRQYRYLSGGRQGWVPTDGNFDTLQQYGDGNGLQRAVPVPLGYRVTYARDQYGNVVSVSNALGAITTQSFGAHPER